MKTNTNKKIDELLISAKLRRTQSRIKILRVLLGVRKPLTQEQIARRLEKAAPDKVTIYRCLEVLVEKGVVHKAFLQNRTWYFELSSNCTKSQCHPHFTCKRCGLTLCFIGSSLPQLKRIKKGFVIHRQQVRLEGLCPRCA